MPKVVRVFALLATTIALLATASAAWAAPVGWKSVDVTLQTNDQQSMLLVSGTLPADTKLPFETELAVPAGTQLQWVGEILGGSPSQDPELKYVKTSANGLDVYRFTLTKARIAQVEGVVPNMTTFDGTNYLTALKWTAWQSVPEVRISQRIPQGSTIVQSAPGASVQPGSTGYSFYTKTVTSPKAGDVIDLSYSYALPAATQGGGAATASGPSPVALAILMIVGVGGLGLSFYKVHRKMAAKKESAEPTPAKHRDSDDRAVGAEQKTVTRTVGAEAKAGKSKRARQEPVVEPVPAKRANMAIPVIILLGIFIGGFAIVGAKGTSAAVVDGKISRNFGAASPCQSLSLPYTVNDGIDLNRQGDKVLTGFEGMDGVGVITMNLAQSTIDLAWCESSQSEATMRQAVAKSGLITLGEGAATATSVPATPTAAGLDASGKTQTASVDTNGGVFAPGQIVLKAGIPAEIAFGEAAGCLTEVVFEGLDITQDLTKGPVTVKLPALQAGTYPFACAMGHQGGQVVVQ